MREQNTIKKRQSKQETGKPFARYHRKRQTNYQNEKGGGSATDLWDIEGI